MIYKTLLKKTKDRATRTPLNNVSEHHFMSTLHLSIKLMSA